MDDDDRKQLMCYLKEQLDDENMCCFPPELVGSSCAVVSSSGELRGSNLGQAIDAHEVVIRFNDAQTAGYEADVGSKSSIRFGWNLSPKYRPNDPWMTELYSVCKGLKFKGVASMEGFGLKFLEFNCSYKLAWTLFRNMYPNYLGYPVQRPKSSKWPSVGTLGMFFALKNCRRVTAFGFVPGPKAITAPMHYYEAYFTANCSGRDGNDLGHITESDAAPRHRTWFAEKDLWARASITPLEDIRKQLWAQYDGFSAVEECPHRPRRPIYRKPYFINIPKNEWQTAIKKEEMCIATGRVDPACQYNGTDDRPPNNIVC